MHQIYLFLISIAFGVVLRILFIGQTKLAKYGKNRALKIALDVFWCLISFGGFYLISFFAAGGEFHIFMLAGTIAGFFGVMLVPFGKIFKRKFEEN
ncbi:MAG: hypothetical protein FWE22_05050 [Firmicutes bacterium]|nr:hypothetical protein [Bacillota bacterium]